MAGAEVAGAGVTGAGAAAGAVAVGAVPLAGPLAGVPPSAKNCRQAGSSDEGSDLYRSYISSTSHWLVPKSGLVGSDGATGSIASSVSWANCRHSA